MKKEWKTFKVKHAFISYDDLSMPLGAEFVIGPDDFDSLNEIHTAIEFSSYNSFRITSFALALFCEEIKESKKCELPQPVYQTSEAIKRWLSTLPPRG